MKASGILYDAILSTCANGNQNIFFLVGVGWVWVWWEVKSCVATMHPNIDAFSQVFSTISFLFVANVECMFMIIAMDETGKCTICGLSIVII
jgi:hypothetical protein